MGIGDDERVGLELGDLGADARELLGRGFAGKFEVVRHHRAVGRRRTVAPDRVDRIGLVATSMAPAAAQALARRSAPSP